MIKRLLSIFIVVTLFISEEKQDFINKINKDVLKNVNILIINNVLNEYLTDCVTPQGVYK